LSQGQTRDGLWALAWSNGCVGWSGSDKEARSNGHVGWSCGSKEEVLTATKFSAWIAGLLAASLTGCVELLRFTPLPLLALYLFRRERWDEQDEVNSFPSCDSAAMQGRLPIDTIAMVRERLAA
jgi:hypothetical protein